MTRMILGLALALAAPACKSPVAPMVPSCSDDYRPAMCLDGNETCETDDNGCRVCICERDEPSNPAE